MILCLADDRARLMSQNEAELFSEIDKWTDNRDSTGLNLFDKKGYHD